MNGVDHFAHACSLEKRNVDDGFGSIQALQNHAGVLGHIVYIGDPFPYGKYRRQIIYFAHGLVVVDDLAIMIRNDDAFVKLIEYGHEVGIFKIEAPVCFLILF